MDELIKAMARIDNRLFDIEKLKAENLEDYELIQRIYIYGNEAKKSLSPPHKTDG